MPRRLTHCKKYVACCPHVFGIAWDLSGKQSGVQWAEDQGLMGWDRHSAVMNHFLAPGPVHMPPFRVLLTTNLMVQEVSDVWSTGLLSPHTIPGGTDILRVQPSCCTLHPTQFSLVACFSLWQWMFLLIPKTSSENMLPWKLLEVFTYWQDSS